jgi:transcriptional regulator with XRE-family HTH domain
MPRNTSQAVRSGSASTQAIVRSEQPHWEPPPKKINHSAPSVTKLPCPRIPAPQIERIKQRHIMGQSQREIARAEGRSRPTIARIVKGEEMQAFVQEMRERFYGLAPDALATIEYALREQKDARIAYDILRDVGVAPRKGEEPQLPATPEDGYSRQAIMVANVLLEAHDNLGVDLPENVAAALAKDAQGNTEAAKTSGSKLLRR